MKEEVMTLVSLLFRIFIYNLKAEFSELFGHGIDKLFAGVVQHGLEQLFCTNKAIGVEITFDDAAKLAHYANKNTKASTILFHTNGILRAMDGPQMQVCYDGTAKYYLVLFADQTGAQPRAFYDSAIYRLPEDLSIIEH